MMRYFFYYLLFAIIVIVILFPMLWTFSLSIKTHSDITASVPKFIFEPTTKNYRGLFTGETGTTSLPSSKPNFPRYFLNGIVISGGATLLALLLGIPAAYALTRARFKKESSRENIAFTILSFWFGPELAIVLPLYQIYQRAGLIDTYWGLILVYQLIAVPFVVWMCRSYFLDIPVSIEEASRVDGCSHSQTFFRVVLPLAKGGIAATALLAFIFCWNSFVFALVVCGEKTMPVTTGSLGFIRYQAVLWGQMSAAIIISALPAIVLAILLQKHIVRGLTFGSVKE
ncbi:MAG: carbohydrate ABC transporter permease [Candidatus Atribacteria bacterium]|nr:carbohydrate ABC transporter permease [Candidatus Atribacteria bacterium]